MAKRKLTMRKIREILRLKWELKLSDRQVARSVHVSHSTVREYVKRAEQAGLAWPLPEEMGDRELRERLFPTKQADQKQRPLPDWEKVEQELSRPGVTRMLLWTEYHKEHPEGYGYSQFCELYRQWTKAQAKPVMRLPKKAGEEVQVDYSGLTMGVIEPKTGVEHNVEIFVGVLSASGLIYAEAHPSQRLPDWIAAHGRMFRYFGGVPRLVCPDNLKSGVRSPDFYEPDLNPTYQEMAAHYGVAVLPARVRKPKDKALVENAVLQVERWVLAPLRNQRFFSLAELNQAIRQQLEWLNDRPMSESGHSRRVRFERMERSALQPLPAQLFVYREVKTVRVHIDYHVTFHKHHYSVPHRYTRRKVLLRASAHTVEVYDPEENRRIACHARCDGPGYSTEKAHMPPNHRSYLEWSPERFTRWAQQIGPQTAALIALVLQSRPHPQQAYRACLGILNLSRRREAADLEAACALALQAKAYTYRTVKCFLDAQPQAQSLPAEPHANVRGEAYYA